MINWPAMHFGPVNLYTMPRMPMYIELEGKYCKNADKELLTERRKEFNRLWNDRAMRG